MRGVSPAPARQLLLAWKSLVGIAMGIAALPLEVADDSALASTSLLYTLSLDARMLIFSYWVQRVSSQVCWATVKACLSHLDDGENAHALLAADLVSALGPFPLPGGLSRQGGGGGGGR